MLSRRIDSQLPLLHTHKKVEASILPSGLSCSPPLCPMRLMVQSRDDVTIQDSRDSRWHLLTRIALLTPPLSTAHRCLLLLLLYAHTTKHQASGSSIPTHSLSTLTHTLDAPAQIIIQHTESTTLAFTPKTQTVHLDEFKQGQTTRYQTRRRRHASR